MEAGFGGPVWHVSVAVHNRIGPIPVVLWSAAQHDRAWAMTQRLLHRVGDSTHEWTENGKRAVHLRRRLTDTEWGGKPWGMDYRNTAEGRRRLEPVRHLLPIGYSE